MTTETQADIKQWSDLDMYVGSFDGELYCMLCAHFKHRGRAQVRNHIEARHFKGTFTHICKHCKVAFNCKMSLNNHMGRECKMNPKRAGNASIKIE